MFGWFRWLAVWGVLLFALLSSSVAPVGAAPAQQFTPAQRAEIVQILREALTQDPSILRDAVAALQADEAKRQADKVLAQKDALISPDDPRAGNPHGDVTIVEFFDVRCPYCRKMEPDMARLLGDDHGVRLVYKDLPILGPASILGSRALLAAQKQGGYESLRTVLMQAPPQITEASIQAAAEKAGLDWPRLKQDMADPAIQKRLNANLDLARDLGIEGTPALVVGKQFIPGAVSLAELRQAVAEARAKP
ncbi:MAG: DsbA family protein [Acetobacteraceae bacterium]